MRIPEDRRTGTAWLSALLLLLAAMVTVTPPAAVAAVSTFTQQADVRLGGPSFFVANTASITLPEEGVASPYPAEISVPYSLPVADLEVQLLGFTHGSPGDVDVLLVGPGGQTAIIMSDAGGSSPVSGVNLSFDDEADRLLPSGGTLSSGFYQPGNHGAGDPFISAPPPSGNTALSVFDGSIAAGVWRLYVIDDFPGVSGQLAGGWRLVLDLGANPYPSTNPVSGLPVVSDVNVVLHGLTSGYPDDIDLLLVGPGGQQATLMSDAGGGDDVANLDIRLDDEAPAPLPDNSTLSVGTFRPSNHGLLADAYDPPAPTSTGASTLSVFDGLSPNGSWLLYAMDDEVGDVDMVLGGWSLEFTWSDVHSPQGAVTVNGGAAFSSSKVVTLSLAATDPAPASGVAHMRFSNDGVTFSPYQPYAASATWELAGGNGVKTVYAQFRDGDGNESAGVSDAIVLDQVGPRAKRLLPGRTADGVAVGSKVRIKASEKLKAGTVRKKTVYLVTKGSAGTVAAKVRYRSSTRTIVLTPAGDLRHRTTYKVTVRGVKDLAGNKWDEKPKKAGAQALRFSFTTG